GLQSCGLTHFGRLRECPAADYPSILASRQRDKRWSLQGGIVTEDRCHGRVGEVTCASLWCPVRSTCRLRRCARNLFACTRFGGQLRVTHRVICRTRRTHEIPSTDRRRGFFRRRSRISRHRFAPPPGSPHDPST